MRSDVPSHAKIDADLLRSVKQTGPWWYVTVAVSGMLALVAVFAFAYQFHYGIGVWGLNRPVMWAFDITNYVFWIGISQAGTLISAILRVTGAEWRRPVTRCAEAITIFALMIGGMFPIMHLGKPELFYWLAPYPNALGLWPNYRSPLMWDFFAINTYMCGSIIYLYLPLIPDLALLRDKERGIRKRIYGALSLGWRGTQVQWDRLERAIRVMSVVIILVGVSMHSILAWDFATVIQPMWHSTIFGPYFVVGAIFSGIAALIIAMAIIRRVFHLADYFRPAHFNSLGLLMLTMSLLWFYMTFAEHLTVWYGNMPEEMVVYQSKTSGPYAPLFWAMVACCFIIPTLMLSLKRLRTVTGTVMAAVGVIIGMWLERFLIIVPTLAQPVLTYTEGSYQPTWVEIALTVGVFGYFVFLYAMFTKVFPIVAIWEYKEGITVSGHARQGRSREEAERMAVVASGD